MQIIVFYCLFREITTNLTHNLTHFLWNHKKRRHLRLGREIVLNELANPGTRSGERGWLLSITVKITQSG